MTDYSEVRDAMLPGDLIAFGGKGHFSSIIKRFTRSDVSHVGLIRHSQLVDAEDNRYFNEIIESTTLLDGVAGVTTSRLSRRVEGYEGELWWLPLDFASRTLFDATAYWDWLYEQDGKAYDMRQALGSGFDWLESIGVGVNDEDFSQLFCSELGAGALRAAGVLFRDDKSAMEASGIDICFDTEIYIRSFVCSNASEETPIQLCRRPIWDTPVQLKGEPLELLRP